MSFFNDYLNAVELPLLKSMHDALECDFLDAVMPVISNLCKWGVLWIAIAAILLCFRKTRRVGVTVALALIIGFAVGNGILKPLFSRIRPYNIDTALNIIIPKEKDFSFPSGHALASVESAFSIFIHDKKWGTAALVVALLIAFSRVYLMMHFFTDVIAGVLLGILFAIAAYYIGRYVIKRTKMPV